MNFARRVFQSVAVSSIAHCLSGREQDLRRLRRDLDSGGGLANILLHLGRNSSARARRKLVAVNSGVGVDLYGQACSEMIPRTGPDGKVTPVPYSGVGGQVDFFRAVQRSPGGMGFLTLRSTVKNGTVSTITLDLAPGLVVTTNRYDMDRVATEWGVAELRGKDVVARAQALIRVAHPRFRAELARQGLERFGGDPKSWQIASRVTQAEQRLVAQLEPAPVTTASK